MTNLEIAALYAGINLLILLVSAVRVTLGRRKHRVSFGDGGNPEVLRRMRAHGNAAEYIPAAIGALVLLSLLPNVSLAAMHLMGGVFTVGRLAHVYAISTQVGPQPGAGRAIGMVLTWGAYAAFAVALIWGALTPSM